LVIQTEDVISRTVANNFSPGVKANSFFVAHTILLYLIIIPLFHEKKICDCQRCRGSAHSGVGVFLDERPVPVLSDWSFPVHGFCRHGTDPTIHPAEFSGIGATAVCI
jgi:hypothetical protein